MRPGVVWFEENLDAQLIGQIDHGVNATTEKVGHLHTQIPQKFTSYKTFPEELVYIIYLKKLVFIRVFRFYQGRLLMVNSAKDNDIQTLRRTQNGEI